MFNGILIMHGIGEPSANRRIDPVCLRQGPRTPPVEFLDRSHRTIGLECSESIHVLAYCIRLLEGRCVFQQPINPCLLDLPLSLFRGFLGCDLALAFLLFKFRFPFNMPLVLVQCAIAVLAFGCENDFDGNLCHECFQLALAGILPG